MNDKIKLSYKGLEIEVEQSNFFEETKERVLGALQEITVKGDRLDR